MKRPNCLEAAAKHVAHMDARGAAVVMRLTLRYVTASLVYLVAGITLAALTFSGILRMGLAAYYFMQLYGFVAMMIFGLSYLFIPAFSHAYLHSIRLARVQFWLANFGTIGLTVGFSGYIPVKFDQPVIYASFVLQSLAIYAHAYNIWMTIRGWKGSPGETFGRKSGSTSSSG